MLERGDVALSVGRSTTLHSFILTPKSQYGKGARVVVAQGGGRFQPRPVEAEDLGEDEIVIRLGA